MSGLRLITLHRGCRADLIDERGEVHRTWSVDDGLQWERALYLEDGGLLVIGADGPPDSVRARLDPDVDILPPDPARYLLRFAPDGTVAWKKYLTIHHDVEVLEDGRLAALGFARRRVPSIHPQVEVRDDLLWILDPDTGTPVEVASLLDLVRPFPEVFPLQENHPSGLPRRPWIDLFHSNSIEWMTRAELFDTHPLYDPSHVLVSFRHQDRVAIFDPEEGVTRWAWGEGEIRGPHDAQLLPDGTILLFDNGLGLGVSRALQVDPRTNEIVWEWHADPPESFYSMSRGSAQRLPNGNTLLAESNTGRALEVDTEGHVVWEWWSPHFTESGRRYTIVRAQWVGPATP